MAGVDACAAIPGGKVNAVDFFAGAGGFSTGATHAGLHVAAAANHWDVAVATHTANHPATAHYCQDVGLIDVLTLPAFDVLLASPECTGHTRARGVERPHHDASRATAWCVIRTAELCRPRVIVVENVPEFASWALYRQWRACLSALGYRVAEQVLDAADFGVPQERVRLFVTASLGQRPHPVVARSIQRVTAREIVDLDAGKWTKIDRPGRAPKTIAQAHAARARHGDVCLIAYYGSSRDGRSLDRPLGTVTTHDRYAVVRGDEMRMLTIDELRAACGFPAGYVLTGTHAERVMQLGNAVPPPLARAVVEGVM